MHVQLIDIKEEQENKAIQEENNLQVVKDNVAKMAENFIYEMKDMKMKNNSQPSFLRMLCMYRISRKVDKLRIDYYAKARDIINEKLDISQYLKFVEEYVKLKEVLFDDVSNICLTLRIKPKINAHNNFMNIHLPKKERLERILTYYLMNKKEIEDDRFFTILPENIQKLIITE